MGERKGGVVSEGGKEEGHWRKGWEWFEEEMAEMGSDIKGGLCRI